MNRKKVAGAARCGTDMRTYRNGTAVSGRRVCACFKARRVHGKGPVVALHLSTQTCINHDVRYVRMQIATYAYPVATCMREHARAVSAHDRPNTSSIPAHTHQSIEGLLRTWAKSIWAATNAVKEASTAQRRLPPATGKGPQGVFRTPWGHEIFARGNLGGPFVPEFKND